MESLCDVTIITAPCKPFSVPRFCSTSVETVMIAVFRSTQQPLSSTFLGVEDRSGPLLPTLYHVGIYKVSLSCEIL